MIAETKTPKRLRPEALERLLEVTRKLAAPSDTTTMLAEVVEAARSVLDADGGSVWLFDPRHDMLVMQVGTGIEPIRLPAGRGIVGLCARTRELVNVPDCYADPRFNPEVDRETGYRTRCLLCLPLIGHDDVLVGVLQLFNKRDGVFDGEDESVAAALAAQCAVTIQRVQMTEAMIAAQKLDREIKVAREIQTGTLPKRMPSLRGYDIAGTFLPTDQTGGDTFDFVPLDEDRLMILVGDATGHGIGPALSAIQVRAMLRMALRIGADLNTIFTHINNQLAEDLPPDRFVTAFFGLLDARSNTVQFLAGGQGPILHFRAAADGCDWHPASTYPMGFQPRVQIEDPQRLELEPGDLLGLISDGLYDYESASGQRFGEAGVAAVVRRHHREPMNDLVSLMLESVREFGGAASQADDITIVLIRRLPA